MTLCGVCSGGYPPSPPEDGQSLPVEVMTFNPMALWKASEWRQVLPLQLENELRMAVTTCLSEGKGVCDRESMQSSQQVYGGGRVSRRRRVNQMRESRLLFCSMRECTPHDTHEGPEEQDTVGREMVPYFVELRMACRGLSFTERKSWNWLLARICLLERRMPQQRLYLMGGKRTC